MNTHPDILSEVLGYIEENRGGLRRLAREAGVSYDWLCSVHQGRRKDPRISGIQKLLDHRHRYRESPSGKPRHADVCNLDPLARTDDSTLGEA